MVQQWLRCLQPGHADPPIAVVCEYIEDLVVLYRSRTVFTQLKTRDRGSWSDARVASPGHGIDALSRTHLALTKLKQTNGIEYALWLEGAASETAGTAAFFADPTTAGKPIRDRLRGYGLTRAQQTLFLQRLSISPNRPPRDAIDAVILLEIGLLWPSMTHPEREQLYAQLLAHAETAQAGEDRRDGWSDSLHHLAHLRVLQDNPPENLPHRILTLERLQNLTPPLPTTVQVLADASRPASTALTQKLSIAGATSATREKAVLYRAQAEIRRQELLSTSSGPRHLDELADRLLDTAVASAVKATLGAGGNPRMQARVGDYVFNDLRSRPHDLLALDRRGLFDGEHLAVLGFLCQLSDECKFAWREVSA